MMDKWLMELWRIMDPKEWALAMNGLIFIGLFVGFLLSYNGGPHDNPKA